MNLKPRPVHIITALALGSTLLANGCATSKASSHSRESLAITQPKDLLGTTWKLPMSAKGRDGRKIEFRYNNGALHAVLTNVGDQLDKVAGAYEGLVLMELAPDGKPTHLTGIERIPGRELTPVHCSVSATGQEMKCNNEDWVWMRES